MADWSDAVTKQVTTVVVSVITSLITTGVAFRIKKRELWLNHRVQLIRQLQSNSCEVLKRVKEHMLYLHKTETAQKSNQAQIMSQIKELGFHLASLQSHYPEPEKANIFMRFLAWKGSMTGEGFPAIKKAAAVQSGSNLLAERDQAHQDWHQYLEGLVKQNFS